MFLITKIATWLSQCIDIIYHIYHVISVLYLICCKLWLIWCKIDVWPFSWSIFFWIDQIYVNFICLGLKQRMMGNEDEKKMKRIGCKIIIFLSHLIFSFKWYVEKEDILGIKMLKILSTKELRDWRQGYIKWEIFEFKGCQWILHWQSREVCQVCFPAHTTRFVEFDWHTFLKEVCASQNVLKDFTLEKLEEDIVTNFSWLRW